MDVVKVFPQPLRWLGFFFALKKVLFDTSSPRRAACRPFRIPVPNGVLPKLHTPLRLRRCPEFPIDDTMSSLGLNHDLSEIVPDSVPLIPASSWAGWAGDGDDMVSSPLMFQNLMFQVFYLLCSKIVTQIRIV